MKVRNQGFALIFAVIVMAVAGALLTGLLFNSTTSLQINSNDLKSAYAKTLAETGLNKMQTAAYQSYSFYSDGHWQDYDLTAEQASQAACENYLAIGLDLDRERDGDYNSDLGENYRTVSATNKDIPIDTPVATPVTLPDGVEGGFEITLTNDGDRSILQSRGYLGDNVDDAKAVSSSLASIKLETTASVWENAIFANGATPGAGIINGNVSIYGSVHLVGTPDDGVALDVSGTSGIYSSYLGEESGSNDIVSEMSRITDNEQPNICTRVRIKEGDLSFSSGSAQAGTTNYPLQSVELGGDVVGGEVGDEVITESGDIDPYDPDLEVVVPTLDDTYPNETDTDPNYFGAGVTVSMIDLSNTLNPTAACGQFTQTIQGNDKVVFSSTSHGSHIDPTPLGTTCSSPGATAYDGAAMAWLSTSTSCTLANAVSPPSVSSGNGYLCIAGTNPIANSRSMDILFYGDVDYKGKGTIRAGSGNGDATANIEVESSLLPLNDYFPKDSIISLVSSGTMDLGTTSGAEIAAIIFALKSVGLYHQTLLVGSIVAESIDIGSQVPSIAYETHIMGNMPVGSPGKTDVVEPYLIVEAYERR